MGKYEINGYILHCMRQFVQFRQLKYTLQLITCVHEAQKLLLF